MTRLTGLPCPLVRRGSGRGAAGHNFVWNTTNLSRRIRGGLIDRFADYGARVRIVDLEALPDEKRRRNAARRDPVIARMLDN